MRTTWNAGIWTVAATALLTATVAAAPAPPDTSRKEVLALNAITGEDAELGRIFQLLEDTPHTKSLLAEAAKLAKEKDQPLNVTAAYVLAAPPSSSATPTTPSSSTSSTSTNPSSCKALSRLGRATRASSRPTTTAASTKTARRSATSSWPSRATRPCSR